MKLDDKQLSLITNVILTEQNKQQEKFLKDKRDRRLRNTTLLLKNYQKLKRHCETIVGSLEVYEDSVYDPDELNLHSLMKYKARTAKMLDYFDVSFKVYSQYCKGKGIAAERRCSVIEKSYIQKQAMKKIDIAELYGLDERTIRRDEAKAIEELSVILFGVDSINDLITHL